MKEKLPLWKTNMSSGNKMESVIDSSHPAILSEIRNIEQGAH
jgi:hypothetical protein